MSPEGDPLGKSNIVIAHNTGVNEMKTLLIIAILVLVASAGQASTFEINETAGEPQMQVYVERPITDQVGGFLFNCQSKDWGQTQAGLTYSPVAWAQIGLGAGIETGGTRIGGSIWTGVGNVSGIYFLEHGSSGGWDKLVTKYQVAPRLALGWTEKAGSGQGVYADFKISQGLLVKYSGFKKPEIALQLSF